MIYSDLFSLSAAGKSPRGQLVDGSAFGIGVIQMALITNNGPSVIYVYQGGASQGDAIASVSAGNTSLLYIGNTSQIYIAIDPTPLLINNSFTLTTTANATVLITISDNVITGNSGRSGTCYVFPEQTFGNTTTIKAVQLGFDLIRSVTAVQSTSASGNIGAFDSNGNLFYFQTGAATITLSSPAIQVISTDFTSAMLVSDTPGLLL